MHDYRKNIKIRGKVDPLVEGKQPPGAEKGSNQAVIKNEKVVQEVYQRLGK